MGYFEDCEKQRIWKAEELKEKECVQKNTEKKAAAKDKKQAKTSRLTR